MPLSPETYQEVITMPPLERAKLIDDLLVSLDIPDQNIDEAWKKEIEERVQAFEKGELTSKASNEVFTKYEK